MLRREFLAAAASLAGSSALAQVPGVTSGSSLFIAGGGTTWNPMDAGASMAFSNNNLTWTCGTASRMVRGTTSRSTGKWYFEQKITTSFNFSFVGIATSANPLGHWLGQDSTGYGYANNGAFDHVSTLWQDGSVAVNNIVGVAVDLTTNKIYVAVNNTWRHSSNPSANTGGTAITAGTYFPAAGTGASIGGSIVAVAAFKSGSLNYAPPSGFAAWG